MKLTLPKRFKITSENTVIRDDIFNTIQNNVYDLAYFDPPYGSNNEKMPPSRIRYDSYYHIWKSVILNDKPELFGKANRRIDSKDNVNSCIFEEYKKFNIIIKFACIFPIMENVVLSVIFIKTCI